MTGQREKETEKKKCSGKNIIETQRGGTGQGIGKAAVGDATSYLDLREGVCHVQSATEISGQIEIHGRV